MRLDTVHQGRFTKTTPFSLNKRVLNFVIPSLIPSLLQSPYGIWDVHGLELGIKADPLEEGDTIPWPTSSLRT